MAFSQVVATQGARSHRLLDAEYDFTGDSTSRYLQSVEQLANCTMAHSVLRTSHVKDFDFDRAPYSGWDHVFISHQLWYGRAHFIPEQLFVRRYFSGHTLGYQQRLTGLSEGNMRDYRPRTVAYIEDFTRLQRRHEANGTTKQS